MYQKNMNNYFLWIIVSFSLSSMSIAADELVAMKGPHLIVDLRYATTDNFLHHDVYREFGLDQCYVDPQLKTKIDSISDDLKKHHVKLVFFDCFRPLSVQQAMWKLVPDSRYVANPKNGSNHNRGVAIDVTLADEQGQQLKMPTEFDDFTEKAASTYPCAEDQQQACDNRALLKSLLTKAGLINIRTEWWHFELPNAKSYPIRTMPDAQPK